MTGFDPAPSSPPTPGPAPAPDGPAEGPADHPASHAAGWLGAGPAVRSRLEARLNRTSVVVASVAGVGLALVLLALFATDLLRDLLLSTRWRGSFAIVINSLLTAAAALWAWVLFYALRLAGRSGRLTPGDAAGNLRKLRVGTCILLVTSLALFMIGASGNRPVRDWELPVPGLLASAACCYLLVSLRRLAWDVAVAEGAVVVRPGGARGFAVLSPQPALAEGAAVPVALATAPSAAALPGAHRGVHPGAADAPPWEEGSGLREWETLLTVLAVLAIAVYLFRTPAAVAVLAALVDRPQALTNLAAEALGARTRSSSGESTRAWIVLASLGLALCATAWVFWGVICLAAGARLRIAAVTLAAVTLGLLAVVLGAHLFYMMRYRSGFFIRSRYEDRLIDPFGTDSAAERVALECVLPVVLLFVLTRKPVKEFFSHRLSRPRP